MLQEMPHHDLIDSNHHVEVIQLIIDLQQMLKIKRKDFFKYMYYHDIIMFFFSSFELLLGK